ncbi:MAG: MBL fold metallo-hydrolase [Actinomycetota bacterium]|nr:MBL fold metallo-hydrolase [Actinomycetota bacterium]
MQPDAEPIARALHDIGARWPDLTDVVLTHAHPDHCGALTKVTLWRRPQSWGRGG